MSKTNVSNAHNTFYIFKFALPRFTLLSDYTLCLLIHSGELIHKFSYADIMRAAFGKCGEALLAVTIFLYTIISK
jgi:hypothetical protein